MGKYFAEFCERADPHLSKLGSREGIYTKIFSWYFTGRGKDFSLDKSQISRWAGGKPLTRRITDQAINSPEAAAQEYARVFDSLLYASDENDKDHLSETSGETPQKTYSDEYSSVDMLYITMDEFLQTFPYAITFKDVNHSIAEALTTALVYDGIHEADKYRIDPGIYNSISKKLKECKNKNEYFSIMYVLDILMQPPMKLLTEMLKASGNDLEKAWKDRIGQYKREASHNSYAETSLIDIEVVEHAKLLAYFKPVNSSRSHNALEIDFCRALVRCDENKSSTIDRLKKDLGNLADYDKWDALAVECQKKLGTGSN